MSDTSSPETDSSPATSLYVIFAVATTISLGCCIAAGFKLYRQLRGKNDSAQAALSSAILPSGGEEMSVPSDSGNNDDAKDDTYTPPMFPFSNGSIIDSEGSDPATADPTRRTTHNTSADDQIGPTDNKYAHIQKGRQLGGGAFGDVFQVKLVPSGKLIAMKESRNATEEQADHALREIRIICTVLPHRHLMEVFDMQYTRKTRCLRIFMELVSGGTLAEYVNAAKPHLIEEREASNFACQILEGIRTLHAHTIVHRDIKSENVLLTEDKIVKLCDYGSLKELREGTTRVNSHLFTGKTKTAGNSVVGSPNWLAPEVVIGGANFVKAGPPADIYAFGCTVSEILNKGVPPGINHANEWEAILHIQERKGLPENIAEFVSDTARQLIEACLIRNPADRPTAAELLEHSWIEEYRSASLISAQDVSPPATNTAQGQSPVSPTTPGSPTNPLVLSARQMDSWQRVGAPLGKGSFGTVYLGQLSDARTVAVKEIDTGVRSSDAQRQRFAAEFRLMQTLSHKNIVKYLGHQWTGSEGQTLQIFLEYLSGGSVRKLVKSIEGGRLRPEVIRRYTRDVLEGLAYLHEGGRTRGSVAHRDVKGDNLLIDTQDGRVKLADFGCSKLFEEGGLSVHSFSFEAPSAGAEGAQTFAGTPNWMAPEVLRSGSRGGTYGTKCDIWSLGCTVIEMMGRTPWRQGGGETPYEVLHRIASSRGGPPLPEGVGDRLKHLLNERCFVRDPAKRANAKELLQHPYLHEEVLYAS